MRFSHLPVRTIFLVTVFVTGVTVTASFGTLTSAQAQTRRESRVPNIYDAQRAVEEYVDSGNFDRDRAKVVAAARRWLDKRVKTVSKPAIVVDIDETALDNREESRINHWVSVTNGPCDLEKGPCGHRAWQAMARAKAIASTLALVKHARELGVAVFFISGRPDWLRDATERNLREQGYEWTKVILEPNDTKFSSAADFKAPERRKISEEGYSIILSLGDQESDLKGGYAERTFKLPNPIYFVK